MLHYFGKRRIKTANRFPKRNNLRQHRRDHDVVRFLSYGHSEKGVLDIRLKWHNSPAFKGIKLLRFRRVRSEPFCCSLLDS